MIRVLIVDDHKIVRDGLKSMLEDVPNVDVIEECGDGRSGVDRAVEARPDVVVMDIGMQGLNGIDATRQIVEAAPDVKVVVLSVHNERSFVLGALQAGASGYLEKDCPFEELRDAIASVAAGRAYLSSGVTHEVVQEVVAAGHDLGKSDLVVLSAREREVLQLLAEGRANKEIADQLAVSIKTVDRHRQNIMKKLGLHTVAELTKYAVKEGITQL